MSNNLAIIEDYFAQDMVLKKIEQVVWENKKSFVLSAMELVNSTPALQKCKPETILSVLIMAVGINLPLNKNLWFAYAIPYWDKATFQMWYKWYIQLAINSKMYERIKSVTVYEWQLVEENPIMWNTYDWKNKSSDKVVWYLAYFKLNSENWWYTDELYMSYDEMEQHAKRYSQTYRKTNWGLWKTDFDAMAEKTVLKLLLSKKWPLCVDKNMQKALIADQSVITDVDTMQVEYPENPPIADTKVEIDEELLAQWKEDIAKCNTEEELNALFKENKPTQQPILDLFTERKNAIKENDTTIQD